MITGKMTIFGGMMSAYLIARINVTDWDQYREYTKLTPDIIAEHGGRFISRGGDLTMLEGEEETRRVVLIEFDTVAAAKGFYYSEAYQAAIKVRENASEAQFLIVDGV